MLESRIGGRQRPLEPVYSHSRSRTSSSNVLPQNNPYNNQQQYQQIPTMQVHLAQPGQHQYHPTMSSRRSPSVNTFNSAISSSSSTMAPPAAYRTSPTMTDLHRTASNRSGGAASISQHSGSSYVALLRKQKATVWSDRAQPEDPRMAAAQRAAKMRAAVEMNGGRRVDSDGVSYSGGGQGTGRTATGLSSVGGKVGAKIRHHGKPGVVGYTPDNNYAAGVGGVPLRLSATEVEGEDSDEDDYNGHMSRNMAHHRRTGSSGRSSTASGRLRHQQSQPGGSLTYRTSGRLGSMGSAAGRRWSPGDTPERTGSLVENEQSRMSTMASTNYPADETRSFASGSSAERADAVPDMAAQNRAKNSAQNAALTREKSVKTVDELKRRGSVDERTMTLTGSAGRLFIANPD
ncbi:hypothetical protein MCOR25_009139 [Pyricularia grisea]|nr:hypothetical protein MCOR25_009139 [Pyricularia grisea]